MSAYHRYKKTDIRTKNKLSFYTKQFSDIKLIYCEKYPNEHKAALREKQIKGWSHTKKQRLLTGELGINQCTELVEELVMDDRTYEFTPKD